MFAPLIALAAAAAPAALAGIWEGSIGTLPVRACFAQRDTRSFGSYYYLSRRRLIALEAEEGAEGAFRETDSRQPGAPRWMIERADAARLAARWSHRGRTLPVRLSRVARGSGEQGHCGGAAYHGPRLEGVRTVTARALRDRVVYTRLTLDHGERFDVGVDGRRRGQPGRATGGKASLVFGVLSRRAG